MMNIHTSTAGVGPACCQYCTVLYVLTVACLSACLPTTRVVRNRGLRYEHRTGGSCKKSCVPRRSVFCPFSSALSFDTPHAQTDTNGQETDFFGARDFLRDPPQNCHSLDERISAKERMNLLGLIHSDENRKEQAAKNLRSSRRTLR
jgi:hypothetical protein